MVQEHRRATGCSHNITRVEFQPPLVVKSVDVDSHLGLPKARGLLEVQYPSHDKTVAKILGARTCERMPRKGGRRKEEGRSTPPVRLPKCLNRFTGRSALPVSTMILPQ
ncbi:hypothetical protein HAX54_036080, partial [Datura stramonium]|nr:hypothetical protein [Datura stramonium]